ncbi:MAG: serine/threonine protein kinase [Myxococcales bacterium]
MQTAPEAASKCSLCGELHGSERPCGHPLARLLGHTLDGRYRIDSVLGKGGMGVVFQATQTSVQRKVAIKMLNPSLADTPMFFERFRREAELASRLHHPNIITIYDFGKSSDGCYYVMELLEGDSLRSLVRHEGPLPMARALRIIEQIARALANAHGQGVIHRDLKPHNVMVSAVDGQDHCKVLDFGLVKMLEEDNGGEQLTTTGQVLGTPAYMAPEQAAGDPCDQRADLYSLGVCLFYCLAGSTPFKTNSAQKALMYLMTSELPKVNSLRVGAPIPEALEEFLKRAMAFSASERPQSAEEFIEGMRAAVAGLTEAQLNEKPQGKVDGPDLNTNPSKVSSAPKPQVREGATMVARPASISRTGSQVSNIQVGSQLQGPSAAEAPAAPKPASKLPLLAGGAVLGVGLVVGVVLLGGRKEEPAAPIVAAPPLVQVQAPVLQPPKPKSATVRIETEPAGAKVYNGAELLGVTPATLVLPREATNFTVRLDGYQPLTHGVDLANAPEGEPTLLKLALVAEAPAVVPTVVPTSATEKKPVKTGTKSKGPDIPIFDD